jgi:hypothetical protein
MQYALGVSLGNGIRGFYRRNTGFGRDLVDKVKYLIHEGNVRQIILKDEHGNTFVEIPVTVAAVGTILAPALAAVGALAARVAKFNIVVVRVEPGPRKRTSPQRKPKPRRRRAGLRSQPTKRRPTTGTRKPKSSR